VRARPAGRSSTWDQYLDTPIEEIQKIIREVSRLFKLQDKAEWEEFSLRTRHIFACPRAMPRMWDELALSSAGLRTLTAEP